MKYNKHKRECETTQLAVQTYKVDGKPTCLSWVGGEGRKPEICMFLYTTHFGLKYACGINHAEIFPYKDGSVLEPHKNCILWRKKNG